MVLAAVLLIAMAPSALVDALFMPTALAQDCHELVIRKAEPDPNKKARRIPHIQPTTHKRLQQAVEFVKPEEGGPPDYPAAVQILEGMIPREGRRSRYNGNELGQIHDTLAFIYWELDRPDKTIHHYEQVLAQVPEIAEGTELITLYQLAKIYFMQGTGQTDDAQAAAWYRKSLSMMDEWLSKSEDPGADAYFFMSQVNYQLDDLQASIEDLRSAICIAQDRGIQVKETWWSMLQSLYYGEEEWEKCIEILEILVNEFPKRDYWVTLAAVHGEMEQDDIQLLVLEAAHIGGFLSKESDIRAYGSLMVQKELPNRAGKYVQLGVDEGIVEPTLDNLKLLANAYSLAEETEMAIDVLEDAAELAEDGKIFDLLATLYLDKDRFAECESASKNALDKGGLANAMRTEITLATCQFNLDKLSDARKTFAQVRREARAENESRMARIASDWITYIDSESKRREELARADA